MKTTNPFDINTVPASDQVKSRFLAFEKEGSKLKILFIGNSITLHGPKPDIGWLNNWGMAASSIDKDYVHLVVNKIENEIGPISYYVVNMGYWEVNYRDDSIRSEFESLLNLDADIVVLRLGENVPRKDIDYKVLMEKTSLFARAIKEHSKLMVITDQFWSDPLADQMFKDISAKYGGAFAKISDLGNDPTNEAIGLFEHPGVAIHPGDKGMMEISNRIYAQIEPFLSLYKK